MEKFHGKSSELETLVSALGYKGQWEDDNNGKRVFRSEDGAVLNWWPSRGTLQVQGPTVPRTKLERSRDKGSLRWQAVGAHRSPR